MLPVAKMVGSNRVVQGGGIVHVLGDADLPPEEEKALGKLHDRFVSTSGLANPLANSRRLGREIAEQLKAEGVDAVILTST